MIASFNHFITLQSIFEFFCKCSDMYDFIHIIYGVLCTVKRHLCTLLLTSPYFTKRGVC